jgi:hypothetical protein
MKLSGPLRRHRVDHDTGLRKKRSVRPDELNGRSRSCLYAENPAWSLLDGHSLRIVVTNALHSSEIVGSYYTMQVIRVLYTMYAV